MAKGISRTSRIGFGWLAFIAVASSAGAQDTNTVGNPQLKDFELPGTRTTPPQPVQEQPAPATPPATTPPAAEPPAARTPATPPPEAAVPRTERPAPAARNVQRETPRDTRPADAPAATPEVAPAPTDPEALPEAAPPVAPPTTELTPPAPAPVADPASETPWLYIALGALAALLALAGLIFFRKSRAAAEERPEEVQNQHAEPEPQLPAEPDPLFARRTPPKADPVPAPAPVPPAAPAAAAPALDGGIVGISLRPRLELQFRPDRAAATLTETSVQFELTIRNVGNRTARDIRVQARMFNAGADQDREIGAFFAEPAPAGAPPSVAALAPRGEVQLKSRVTLPKDQVREVTIQGRRLFIPLVAFNVLYEWEGGRSGQTSTSYLVGREAPTPQEKMGAFRLDLGPRLYRSVGQRQANLAKVV